MYVLVGLPCDPDSLYLSGGAGEGDGVGVRRHNVRIAIGDDILVDRGGGAARRHVAQCRDSLWIKSHAWALA